MNKLKRRKKKKRKFRIIGYTLNGEFYKTIYAFHKAKEDLTQ